MKRTEKRRRGRPPAFSYRETRQGLLWRRSAGCILHCDEVSLLRLAERLGTPLYVYSASLIREHVRVFERAFRKVPHTICYSVKANSNLSILRLLASLDCGFDVVSGGELERVLRADRRASRKVVFSGVGKTPDEMTFALKAGIPLFNLESESELWTLAECAARRKEKARIAFRVNPDVPANTHPYISTGLRAHKFGVPIRDARRLYTLASASGYLRPVGVSVHIGSQITDMEPFTAAMERVADLVRELRSDGHEIKYVDAGGGLGIAYDNPGESEWEDRVAAYAEAVLRPLARIESASPARAGALYRGRRGRVAGPCDLQKDQWHKELFGGGCRDERPSASRALRCLSRNCSGAAQGRSGRRNRGCGGPGV